MEYADLIQRIMAAERRATEIAKAAKDQEVSIDGDIALQVEALHTSYMDRAKHRLELVAQTERAFAQERIAALDASHQANMERVEDAYRENAAQWVDMLFARIVGDCP